MKILIKLKLTMLVLNKIEQLKMEILNKIEVNNVGVK